MRCPVPEKPLEPPRHLARIAALSLGVLSLACGVGTPARRQVIVAAATGPVTLDPDLIAEEQTASVLGNVYEPLVERGPASTPVPGLAEYWVAQDGDRRWTFRLRPGARFHDGQPVDAPAVAASLERTRARADSAHRDVFGAIERIQVDDARTLSIWTRFPLATLPDRLSNVRIFRASPRPGEPLLGSGPYRLARVAAGGDAELRAVEAATPVQQLQFVVVPAARERAARLLDGRVDLVPQVDPDDRARLAAAPGLRVLTERGLRVLLLGMNCVAPASPFRDVRVRRAVALAVDREALARGPLHGEAAPIAQLVTPTVAGYDAALTAPPRDVERARSLLAEAGFAAGFAVDLEFMPDKYRAMPEVAGALLAQLAEAGVRVTPRARPVAEMLQRVERREAGFYLLGWMTTGSDAGVTFATFFHAERGTMGGGYQDVELSRWLDEASQEFSAPARAALYRRVAQRVAEQWPVVPLYQQTDIHAFSDRLRFTPRIDRRIRGVDLAWRTAGD